MQNPPHMYRFFPDQNLQTKFPTQIGLFFEEICGKRVYNSVSLFVILIHTFEELTDCVLRLWLKWDFFYGLGFEFFRFGQKFIFFQFYQVFFDFWVDLKESADLFILDQVDPACNPIQKSDLVKWNFPYVSRSCFLSEITLSLVENIRFLGKLKSSVIDRV